MATEASALGGKSLKENTGMETGENASASKLSQQRFRVRKRTSPKKIEANRRNALRSTGPKSREGKMTVSRNAIKHGLLVKEVVITAGDGEENSDEFHGLLARLWEDYWPVGIVEEM